LELITKKKQRDILEPAVQKEFRINATLN